MAADQEITVGPFLLCCFEV